jgi:homopolymeric O-antigen transport system ATP-binding protein
MTSLMIRVRGLGKQYHVNAERERYYSIRDSVVAVLRAYRRKAPSDSPLLQENESRFWALRDVDLEVHRGEVLGIIGRNGAGKTTLLKILSRVTAPTVGTVELFGRVGSLLEVGTGFHPELTGRENVFLNGAVLGMRKAEISRKFDEIVSFSGVERFIDTPVKRYSSGMQVRLAFSVAAHLETEIVLVDEVLAVGDAEFQKKCMGKMGQVAGAGRTVLLVSHNMTAVQALCERTIWLDEASIVADGPCGQIVTKYLKTFATRATEQVWDDRTKAPGTDKVRLRRAAVRPYPNQASDVITVATPFVFEFDYWNLEPERYLNLSVILYNEQGVIVLNTAPVNEEMWHGRPFPKGLFRSICHIPGNLLNDGSYRVSLLVVENQAIIISQHDDLLVFDVLDDPDTRGLWFGKWVGVVRPDLEWKTEMIDRL